MNQQDTELLHLTLRNIEEDIYRVLVIDVEERCTEEMVD